MENVVAARRLRKSVLKDLDSNVIDSINNNYYKKENEKVEHNDYNRKVSLKAKIFMRMFISLCLIFACLIIKLFLYENVKDSKIINNVKAEYQKDYTKEDILTKIEIISKKNKKYFSYFIPNSIQEKIKKCYNINVKQNYLDFNFIDFFKTIINTNNVQRTKTISVFNNNSAYELDKKEEKNIVEEIKKSVSPISEISSMEIDIEEIKKKNISIIRPVDGKITSVYGAREEILKGVGTFHTGVDIANSLNTEIKSATDGVVTKVENNNKYYGNNIEITKDGVTFKYAHLNKINVKLNENVKQGRIIGKMGSTGYSTGSHLHFEIIYNSRTVDPQKLVDIR